MKIFISVILVLAIAHNTFGQSAGEKLMITPLIDNFYIYTTYNYYKGNRIGANAMYLVTSEGVVLFDTPWDTTQFEPLLNSIKIKHKKDVIVAFATHFHDDRTGGLEFYRRRGVKTYTTRQTDELSKARGEKRAEHLMGSDTTFVIGEYSFASYYPGPGHTQDNIVFWFEKEKILYGGCLIKSRQDKTLGNLADADVERYAQTLTNVQRKCRHPKFIITGHNDWTDIGSLEHSIKMARALKK